MDEVLEISSDSNDTIIVSNNQDAEFEDLLKKYSNYSKSNPNNSKKDNSHFSKNHHLYDLNSFEKEETEGLECDDELLNKLYKKYLPSSSSSDPQSSPEKEIENSNKLLKELNTKYLSYKTSIYSSDSSSQSSQKIENLPDNESQRNASDEFVLSGQKRKKSNEEDGILGNSANSDGKVTKKQMLEQQRKLKSLNRKRKKENLEKEKARKKAIKDIQKSTKPEEAIKNVIVKIEESIFEQNYAQAIQENLKTNNVSFKSTTSLPGLISWSRKIQSLEDMVCKETTSEEKHYFLILPMKEFVTLVEAGSLMNRLHSISKQTKFHHLTIAVYGMNKPTEDQDYAILEAEMFFKCYWQFLTKSDDLAELVMMVTKAIARIPYKLEQQEKHKLQNEYFNDSNRDTVRVDKNGNGLCRLWNQMLTMFPLARLETAEAITAAYPTPSSLFKAYDECTSKKEELLQNLPIRRAQGPLASVRKIGPELSRKCCNFFTSDENILL